MTQASVTKPPDYSNVAVQQGLQALADTFDVLLRTCDNLQFESIHSIVHQVFLDRRDILDFGSREREDFDRFRDEFFLRWKAFRDVP